MSVDHPHATLKAFGYPDTVIHEYENWVVLLRPAQVTVGSLVIVHKSEAEAYSELDAASFQEYGTVVKDVDAALKSCFSHDKMNYLMLMMVDPHVHYHVIPRYSAARDFLGHVYEDTGWPALPDLGNAHVVNDQERDALIQQIKSAWGQS
jgi:diadenosine tetraphosphate (Ap4A) HIT family hydrolase